MMPSPRSRQPSAPVGPRVSTSSSMHAPMPSSRPATETLRTSCRRRGPRARVPRRRRGVRLRPWGEGRAGRQAARRRHRGQKVSLICGPGSLSPTDLQDLGVARVSLRPLVAAHRPHRPGGCRRGHARRQLLPPRRAPPQRASAPVRAGCSARLTGRDPRPPSGPRSGAIRSDGGRRRPGTRPWPRRRSPTSLYAWRA